MAKKKKPAKKPAKKPTPAKKKPSRNPAPPPKKKPKPKPTIKARPAAPSTGARSALTRSAASSPLLAACTITQPDGSVSLPVGSVSVVVTVNHPPTQVCSVLADIVTTVPGDPLEPTGVAQPLTRDTIDLTKWSVMLHAPTAGNWTILAWVCAITDRCTRAIVVESGT